MLWPKYQSSVYSHINSLIYNKETLFYTAIDIYHFNTADIIEHKPNK